jgi:hypothetical protein
VIQFIYPFQIPVNEIVPMQVLQTNRCVNKLEKAVLTLEATHELGLAHEWEQVSTGVECNEAHDIAIGNPLRDDREPSWLGRNSNERHNVLMSEPCPPDYLLDQPLETQ